MSEEQQEAHNSGLIYFMPAWIFESKDLSNTEKMVYSLLSGLAFGNEEKTCFPSDAYIGKRLGISRQQANECVGTLEKIGAISKVTVKHENNPFKNKRIITVHLAPKIILTESGKADSRDGEKADSTVSGKADTSNKVYSSKGKKPSISPKREEREACGAFVKLSKEEYAKAKHLCGDDLEILIEEMNDYCAAHGKEYKDYLAAIRTWWKKREGKPRPKGYVNEDNSKWAKQVESKINQFVKCHLSAEGFVFEGIGNWPGEYVRFSESGFKDRIINRLRKMGLAHHIVGV